MIGEVSTAEDALRWWRYAYMGVIMIPVLYLHFIFSFLSLRLQGLLILLYAVTASFWLINLLGLGFFTDAHLMFDSVWFFSPNLINTSFIIFFAVASLSGALLLAIRYLHEKQKDLRLQTLLLLIATFPGFVAGSFNFLPTYHIDTYPYMNFLVFTYPIITAYAIYRYQFLYVKVLVTQLIVTTFWIAMLTRVVYSLRDQSMHLVDLALLLLSGLLGIYLLRVVITEQTTRKKGERLARYLANANARLRELDKQKTEFLSVASHQLRSPIAAIKGYAAMINEGSYGEVPDKLQQPVERILQSGNRISIMVDDFLNVTRIEQGRLTYNRQRIELCELVRRAVDELRILAKNNGIALTLETPPRAQFFIDADESKISQVISNIVDNAIKYTPKGFVTVFIEPHEAQKTVVVRVQDSGIGIPQEEIPNLFQKFGRASNANEATVNGTGLGLYIAREIVRAHNGWIHVSSEGVDKGTTFTIELPLASADGEDGTNKAA